jgi:hypothetical protein
MVFGVVALMYVTGLGLSLLFAAAGPTAASTRSFS